MKINLFAGAHGTGKSTIIHLFEGYKSLGGQAYTIADAVSEKFFKREDFKNPEVMVSKQSAFNDYQLEIFKTPGILSSRSHADIWAYTKHLWTNNPDPDYIRQLNDIEFQAINNKGFTNYFYFPICFDIVGKELRSTNKDFQREIDTYILEFFRKCSIDPIGVICGTPEERFKQISGFMWG